MFPAERSREYSGFRGVRLPPQTQEGNTVSHSPGVSRLDTGGPSQTLHLKLCLLITRAGIHHCSRHSSTVTGGMSRRKQKWRRHIHLNESFFWQVQLYYALNIPHVQTIPKILKRSCLKEIINKAVWEHWLNFAFFQLAVEELYLSLNYERGWANHTSFVRLRFGGVCCRGGSAQRKGGRSRPDTHKTQWLMQGGQERTDATQDGGLKGGGGTEKKKKDPNIPSKGISGGTREDERVRVGTLQGSRSSSRRSVRRASRCVEREREREKRSASETPAWWTGDLPRHRGAAGTWWKLGTENFTGDVTSPHFWITDATLQPIRSFDVLPLRSIARNSQLGHRASVFGLLSSSFLLFPEQRVNTVKRRIKHLVGFFFVWF